MTNTEREELTAAELDRVSGGLENTLISNLKLMARRNGQTASDVHRIPSSLRCTT